MEPISQHSTGTLGCGQERHVQPHVLASEGMERESSLIWGAVQNQILHSRGPSCVGTLRNSVSLPQAYQENQLDIGFDTLPIFVLVCP